MKKPTNRTDRATPPANKAPAKTNPARGLASLMQKATGGVIVSKDMTMTTRFISGVVVRVTERQEALYLSGYIRGQVASAPEEVLLWRPGGGADRGP